MHSTISLSLDPWSQFHAKQDQIPLKKKRAKQILLNSNGITHLKSIFKNDVRKKSRHSQLRIWRVRFWGMSFGDIWWRSTSKTQIRWLILATFIPLAPNVASMELPWNGQKGHIHATSTLHQKTVSKWRVYTDRWMIHVKHQCILLIYPILYIWTILLYEFCLYW